MMIPDRESELPQQKLRTIRSPPAIRGQHQSIVAQAVVNRALTCETGYQFGPIMKLDVARQTVGVERRSDR
jgi:hypothetical protein